MGFPFWRSTGRSEPKYFLLCYQNPSNNSNFLLLCLRIFSPDDGSHLSRFRTVFANCHISSRFPLLATVKDVYIRSEVWLYINYQLWCTDYYLFINYYSPLHVSSLKCSSSWGYSCIRATYGTVTLYESSWWPVGTQLEWELTPTNNLPPTVSSHSSCVPTGHQELS